MMTKLITKGALLTSLVGVIFATTHCDEPPPACSASHDPYVAIFTPTTPTSADCAMVKFEEISIGTYNAIGKDNKPNLYSSSIAVESQTFDAIVDTATSEGAVDTDTTHTLYALGYFDSGTPHSDNFCVVPTLTTATQNLPAYPADTTNMVAAADAMNVTYQWTNMRFYYTAEYQGTQFTAELVKTVNGAACGYHVEALAPYTLCGTPDPNDPTGMTTIPNDIICGHTTNTNITDPNSGIPFTGSSINPDFPVKCDPDLQICVLTQPVPALN